MKRGSRRREPPVEVQVHWAFVVPDALQRAAWEELWRRLLRNPQRELDNLCALGGHCSSAADGGNDTVMGASDAKDV
jgi:hypothetical protein